MIYAGFRVTPGPGQGLNLMPFVARVNELVSSMVESPLLTSRWPLAVQAQATIFTSSGTRTGQRLARPEKRFRPTRTGRN